MSTADTSCARRCCRRSYIGRPRFTETQIFRATRVKSHRSVSTIVALVAANDSISVAAAHTEGAANHFAEGLIRSTSFSLSQMFSMNSVSGRSLNHSGLLVQVFVNVVGSSTVTHSSSEPKFGRRNRSVR